MNQPPEDNPLPVQYWQERLPFLNKQGTYTPWNTPWRGPTYPNYKMETWRWPEEQKGWKPSYEPTFWENPVNVARAYWNLKTGIPGQELPEWMTKQQNNIEQAYKYLSFVNNDEDWVNWKFIHPDDPIRGMLQGMERPPVDYTLAEPDYQQWILSELSQKPYKQWDPKLVSQLWPGYQRAMQGLGQEQQEQTDYTNLPTWQKWAISVMNSPLTQGVATSLPFAISGGIGGLIAGGPVGAIIGASAPLALATGLSATQTPEFKEYLGKLTGAETAGRVQTTAADLLKLLDYPAEWLEQGIGLGIQGIASATDPEAYGALDEVLNNLGAAGRAGGLAYTTDAGTLIPNLFPALEYVYRTVTGQDPAQVHFAEPGEVWQLGKAEPVKVDAYRAAALTNIRRELMAGADPDEVTARYSEMFGFSGQLEELVGHMVLDPLNVLPEATTKGIGKVAEIAGNEPLAAAARTAHGPVNLLKNYVSNMKAGLGVTADELTAMQKMIAGINEMGQIKELMPGDNAGMNPVKRAFAHLTGLTPDAQARYFRTLAGDNSAIILNRFRGDVEGAMKAIETLAGTDYRQAVQWGKTFNSPEMYTILPMLRSAVQKLQDVMQPWRATELPREVLGKVAKALGEDVGDIVALLAKDNGADNIYRRLLDLNARPDQLGEVGRTLAQEAAQGRFQVDDLKDIAKAFTGDDPAPWHPDQQLAKMHMAILDHAANWGVQAYGVKPSSPVIRMFDTLKRAQSALLLAWNPAYFVNNAVNNVVTRAASGVFGFMTADARNKFWTSFGLEPYRRSAGVGIAGVAPEMGGERKGIPTNIEGQPVGRYGKEAGEYPIRKAAEAHAGFMGKVNDWLDTFNKVGPATTGSKWVEGLESDQAITIGTKNFYDATWIRDKGFARMPADLYNMLEEFGPGTAEKVYRGIEGAKSKEEIIAKFSGLSSRYQLDQVLPDVAREFGLDLTTARNTLSPLWDDLMEGVNGASTPDDIASAFSRIKHERVQDHLDEMVAQDLKTRAEQVTGQTAGGGMAEAFRIWDEQQFAMAEHWLQHFRNWEEAFTTAEELRMRGASQATINTLFRTTSQSENRSFRRIRNFEKATIKGIMEGLGVDDGAIRGYLLDLEAQHNVWGQFYNWKEGEYSKFFHTDYDTPAARQAAWSDLEARMMESYTQAASDAAEVGRSMDARFVDISRAQFGDNAGDVAARWRATMQGMVDERSRMMMAFRESQVGLPPDVRRGNWTSFLDESYLPFIQEFFRRSIEGSNDVFAAASGQNHLVRFTRELPPGEAPAAAPVQPPPPPTQPPAPEAARPPEQPPVEAAPPVEAPPPPPAVTTPQRVAQQRQIAQEFGVNSANPDGSPVSGFDKHLLAIVKKYGGKEVGSLDEVDPMLLRSSLELRARAKEVEAIAARMKADAQAQVLAQQNEQVGLVDQHNYDQMRSLMEAVERGAGGINQIGAEGEVLGRLARGYPDWYGELSNPTLGKLAGVDAVIQALQDLGEGKIKTKRDGTRYVIYDKLEEIARKSGSFKSYDDLVRAGLAEPIFDVGNWLDRIVDVGSELQRNERIYDPAFIGEQYNKFLEMVGEAPEQLTGEKGEFRPTLDYIQAQFDAVADAARRTEAARLIPTETAEYRAAREAVQEAEQIHAFSDRIDASLNEKAPYPGTNPEPQPELPGLGAETLPLFSGTAQRAVEAPFRPGEAPTQPVMPGYEEVYRPQMEGAREGGEAAGPMFTPGTTKLGPELFQPLQPGEFITRRGTARIIGPDPENPAQFIYELNGERHTMPYIQGGAQAVPPGQMPLPMGQRPATGPIPPGVAEQVTPPEYRGMMEADAWEQRARPLLDALEHRLIGSEQFNINGAQLPPEVAKLMGTYLNGVYGDMSTVKRASMSWGENLRDQALLNYSKRRGFDNILNMVYPYQFWYTRSMWQWLQRAIDRPAWFANYARIRDAMRNKMQTPGFPTRLRDKMAIPAPYLPNWAGGDLWVDPISKIFPFEEFLSPIDDMQKRQSDEDRTTGTVLQQWAQSGEVNAYQAQQAVQTRIGPIWERAKAEAQRQLEADEGGKMDLLSLVLQPALYLTLPYFLATGKSPTTGRSDMPLLPITRTGRTLSSITKDSPLEALGNLVGTLLAAPESALRRAKGISEFGDWGDYYIDRMLASMAADGDITARDAEIAMTERTGPAFEEAMKRADLESALRTPGAAPIYGALHGGLRNPIEFTGATMFGWLPAGLLPTGELEQRQLGELWKQARSQYNLGDTKAMSNFLDDHPEYEARLALWDKPDERLRQFLISEVWDKYSSLGSVEKQAVRDNLGDFFQRDFLDGETRNYDTLDTTTLASWARMLGGYAPQTFETAAAQGTPAMMFPSEGEAAGVNAYRQERSQQFPNFYALQQWYFGLPKSERPAFLKRFPELKDYWEWSRGEKATNPNIEKYAALSTTSGGGTGLDWSFMEQMSPALVRQTIGHYYANQQLSAGALKELQYLWNKAGKPGATFDTFLNQLLRDVVIPQ